MRPFSIAKNATGNIPELIYSSNADSKTTSSGCLAFRTGFLSAVINGMRNSRDCATGQLTIEMQP